MCAPCTDAPAPASFSAPFQVYNEVLRDLLNPSSGVLDLREDARGAVQIAGITEVSTSNAQEVRVRAATPTRAHGGARYTALQLFLGSGRANACPRPALPACAPGRPH